MADSPRTARRPASSLQCLRSRVVSDVLLACVRRWRRDVCSAPLVSGRGGWQTASRCPTGPGRRGRAVASSSTSRPMPIPPSKDSAVVVTFCSFISKNCNRIIFWFFKFFLSLIIISSEINSILLFSVRYYKPYDRRKYLTGLDNEPIKTNMKPTTNCINLNLPPCYFNNLSIGRTGSSKI